MVAVERVVDAPPQRVFDLLADPCQHPVLDGSGSVRAARTGNPARLSAGAQFGMQMRLGAPYRITNQVVEFEEGRRIAWRHFNGHIWRYVLTPEGDGTRIREEWDPTPAKRQLGLRLLGFPRRNERGIRRTLENLAAAAAR